MNGTIFNIQRFSLQDGPGIRTSVFLKGCPLSCAWCHNPEGRSPHETLMFHKDKCTLCRACAAVCPKGVHAFESETHQIDRKSCFGCGACARACVYNAVEICGRTVKPEEVRDLCLRDRPFYNVDGGVTFTGGEPLYQPDFLFECMSLLKAEGVNMCVETSGFAPPETVKRAAEYSELFLYDIKETDDESHKKNTGVSNRIILENLRLLSAMGARIHLRCPIIPGVNFRKDHLLKLAELARDTSGVCRIELEAYHPLGIEKARKAGLIQAYDNPDFMDKSDLRPYLNEMAELAGKPVIIS